MNIRDYIEKVASSRRQLRLAKKHMSKGGRGYEALNRFMAHHDPNNPMRLSRKALRRDAADAGLFHEANHIDMKHRYGRQAAQAYAMGAKDAGDMYKSFGQAEKKDLMDGRFFQREEAKELAELRRNAKRIGKGKRL